VAIGYCPDCGSEIDVGRKPRIGGRVTCSECGFVSEIIDTDPVELDWPYDYEGDEEYTDEEA
jgi:transcription initiation factor TFIIIB Brf1 subunit/transcription initiation factor TFIIB